ncbi:Protein of unknown function [Pyronema omphalodes CBS 100304]|uniref:Uncharacterized protein n=1 Tax=Pyronema omphalodes (strain CBS 100304) TaxID=1076935 RepID=U4KVE5_PYROM|nr:Protein of unknown function [Pyronema omphalodes CBS 100304]
MDRLIRVAVEPGDEVSPVSEASDGALFRLGEELDLEYGTLGCFVWGYDEEAFEEGQKAASGV